MVWWWGEGKRSILWLLPKPFWGVRPVGMIDHPKEASLRGNRWVHALRVERERTQTVVGKGATADKQKKYSSLSGDGRVIHRRNSDGQPVHPNQTKGVKG